jgi:hypothetical protein
MPYSPPLLFTHNLTAALQSNLSAHIQSALLLTPSGKLLCYASPLPARTLRTHAAVAASLAALYASAGPALPDALPAGADEAAAAGPTAQPACIGLSLAGGSVVIVRRLTCGLLFVCMGGGGGEGPGAEGKRPAAAEGEAAPPPPPVVGSPSETGSVGAPPSVATTTTAAASDAGAVNMSVVRRHVEELARWLEGQLVHLSVPEEGIGVGIS